MRFVKALEIGFVACLLILAIVICVGVPMGLSIPGLSEETTETTSVDDIVNLDPTDTTPEQAITDEPIQITWKTYPLDRELTCTRAFVYDCQTETYLFRMGTPTETLYMASITKLFTVHVAMQYLDPEWNLTAGTILDRIPKDASVANLKKGDVMTVAQLVEGMLLPSGNDAAYLIATEAGRQIAQNPELGIDEAIAVFVEEMNRQAQELGLTGTHFTNPDGYHHEDHYTNYNDLVKIAQLAMDNPLILSCTTIPKDTVTPLIGTPKTWTNTNLLVNPYLDYYCPYAIGLKTGQTEAAGSCLLSAFEIDGRRYIIGVFGSPTFNGKLDDTLQLFNAKVLGQ